MTPADTIDAIEKAIKDSQLIPAPAGELLGLAAEIAKKAFIEHPAPKNYLREVLAAGIEADAAKFASDKWGG